MFFFDPQKLSPKIDEKHKNFFDPVSINGAIDPDAKQHGLYYFIIPTK